MLSFLETLWPETFWADTFWAGFSPRLCSSWQNVHEPSNLLFDALLYPMLHCPFFFSVATVHNKNIDFCPENYDLIFRIMRPYTFVRASVVVDDIRASANFIFMEIWIPHDQWNTQIQPRLNERPLSPLRTFISELFFLLPASSLHSLSVQQRVSRGNAILTTKNRREKRDLKARSPKNNIYNIELFSPPCPPSFQSWPQYAGLETIWFVTNSLQNNITSHKCWQLLYVSHRCTLFKIFRSWKYLEYK